MRTLTLFILLTCAALFGRAQGNKLTIDPANPATGSAKVDVTKPLTISMTDCTLLAGDAFNAVTVYKATIKPLSLSCSKGASIDLPTLMGASPDALLDITLTADLKSGKKLNFEFVVNPDGSLTTPGKDKPDPATTQPIPAYAHDFVKPAYLMPVYLPFDATCRAPRIEYDPCCNRYVIYNEKNEVVNHLRYRSDASQNHGVVFLIKNFNTLKYDISLTHTFNNNNTDMPDLFNSVYTMLSGGLGKLASSGDTKSDKYAKTKALVDELSRILKLNQDLKAFLQAKLNTPDCGSLNDFETQRAAIIADIKTEFAIPGITLDFTQPYAAAKTGFITLQQATTASYGVADYNTDIQKQYGLKITPDSLVNETRGLLTTLTTTEMRFQVDIPQLQNADNITFTLNIQPKSGTNGSIHLYDPPIVVPMTGGWKIDFSTGFYYSNKSSNKYALQDSLDATSTLVNKKVVAEPNTGKGTVGATALMHVYPRCGEVQPSFAFGVGTSLDLNYAFLLGGGLIFGKENRVALSTGLSMTNVKMLSSEYDRGGVRIAVPKDVTTIDTYNKFKPGIFFSLTYSLGLTKKSQPASTTAAAASTAAAPASTDSKSGAAATTGKTKTGS